MDAIAALCERHDLRLIEDCAEAFGSRYRGRHVGTFGEISTFSFFGNKTITTGEGGMVVSRREALHRRCEKLKNQGVAGDREYWHDEIAYNYRMTNVCAAIGVAQLERADEIVAAKRRVATWYRETLSGAPVDLHGEAADVVHSYWMNSILVREPRQRDALRAHLASLGIETRPTFHPAHLLPMYRGAEAGFGVAESLGSRGINLPSAAQLTQDEVREVGSAVHRFFATA
jgi:perosamine synthetase